MEHIERHLRGRFSDRLSSECTTHLPRVHQGLVELCFHLSQNPLEGLTIQMESLQNPMSCERSSQMHLEPQCRVVLGLPTQNIVPTYNSQPLTQLPEQSQ